MAKPPSTIPLPCFILDILRSSPFISSNFSRRRITSSISSLVARISFKVSSRSSLVNSHHILYSTHDAEEITSPPSSHHPARRLHIAVGMSLVPCICEANVFACSCNPKFHSLDDNLRSLQLFYLPSEKTNHNNNDLQMEVNKIGDDSHTRSKIVRITNHVRNTLLFYKKMITYALLNSTLIGVRVVKSLGSNIVI